MPSWFNDLTGVDVLRAILFGLGAINLAKNPDGLFALVGRPAAQNAAEEGARRAHRAGRGRAPRRGHGRRRTDPARVADDDAVHLLAVTRA